MTDMEIKSEVLCLFIDEITLNLKDIGEKARKIALKFKSSEILQLLAFNWKFCFL